MNQTLIYITMCKHPEVIKFLIFCSFGMAYDFIDCIGDDVDVVSDSEVCGAATKITCLSSFLKYAHAADVNIFLLSHLEHQEAFENSLQ